MTADESAEAAAMSDARLGDRTLEQLHEDVVGLARTYVQRPLPDVFRAARQTRDLAVRLLDHTRRPGQLADLHAVAGQTCGLLATAAFDMGYWDAAARLADAALTHADIAGHDSLRAWIQGRRANIAEWQDRPAMALTMVEQGLRVAPNGSATTRLRTIEARCRAGLGDSDGTALALRVGEDASASGIRDELHDVIGGEFSFVPARMAFNAASAYVLLGDGETAERHARRSLELYAALPVKERAYYAENGARVDLASARVLRGDLAGAREALLPVFALPPALRVSGLVGRLDRVCELLGADIFGTSREARQLTSDITDFTADTTGRAIPESDL